MKNKGELSYIILILLMEYAFSQDTCERGTYLGQFSFGQFLPRSVFTTKYEVSPYQCATECLLRKQRCKSFNYRRSALSCQLCEEDSGPGGINLQPKAGTDHSNINTWRNIPVGHCKERNCSWTERCDSSKADSKSACVKMECPFAVLKPGVTIQPSNETAVGTKARYICVSEDMERGNYLTTCLGNTEWSSTNFKCVCKNPPVRSGAINETAEVELGQNYTYKCQEGLLGKQNQNPTSTCLHDGNWTPTNFTCVCKTPNERSGTIIETVEVELGQNYTYRCQDDLIEKRDQNPTVMCLPGGNWTTTNFTCVCKTPAKSGAINQTAEVEVGQSYTYRCQSDLFEKGDQNPAATCLHDGSWTSTNFICVKQNWTQDTIYPNNIHKSEVISNVTGNNLLACMQECDKEPTKCLSFFYDNHTSLCVLSASFQRGLPDGFQFSDRVLYYTAPSNSCDEEYRNVLLENSYFCIKHHLAWKSFNEAMKVCESEKAKLLVVTTKPQISALIKFWPTLSWVYIGLSDQTMEGRWVNWQGEKVDPYWEPGQPSESYENCAFIIGLGGIHDIRCNVLMTFLCHKTHF